MNKVRKHTSPILRRVIENIDPLEREQSHERMAMSVRIGDALKKKSISKGEFAALMNKSPSEISKWLSGRHNFTLDTLTAIQNKLGIRLLLEEEEPISYSIKEVVSTNLIVLASDSRSYNWNSLFQQEGTTLHFAQNSRS